MVPGGYVLTVQGRGGGRINSSWHGREKGGGGGQVRSEVQGGLTPVMNRITYTSKNITFPRTLFVVSKKTKRC